MSDPSQPAFWAEDIIDVYQDNCEVIFLTNEITAWKYALWIIGLTALITIAFSIMGWKIFDDKKYIR
jgi:hypothetical protein